MTVSILDAISQLEKGERIIDIRHNVRFAHSSLCTINVNTDQFTNVLSQDLKCLCSKSTTVLLE
jgi:hypothetical protein